MCEKKVPVLNSMTKNRDTHFLKSYTLNYTLFLPKLQYFYTNFL